MTIENLQTPVGRLVWGNPAKSKPKTDQRTKQPVIKDGKQVEQWAFGVAFAKHDFDQHIRPLLEQEARTAYPHGVPPAFSWKYKDGDSIDRSGKPYSLREGYAGHYVVNISTEAFSPPIYKNEGGKYRQVAPEEIKTGYYVALNLNAKVNVPTDPSHTPGLYINPNALELVAYGPEIHNTANPDELFGGRQYQLPPGASMTPVASTGNVGMPIPQQQPPVQTPQQQQYVQPTPQGYPQQQPPVQTPIVQQPGYPQQYQQQTYQAPVSMPPSAPDFIQNAGNGHPGYAPAAPAGTAMPQVMTAPVDYGVGAATTSHFNGMPGVPQGR